MTNLEALKKIYTDGLGGTASDIPDDATNADVIAAIATQVAAALSAKADKTE